MFPPFQGFVFDETVNYQLHIAKQTDSAKMNILKYYPTPVNYFSKKKKKKKWKKGNKVNEKYKFWENLLKILSKIIFSFASYIILFKYLHTLLTSVLYKLSTSKWIAVDKF